jgi:dephospho-CoA kinase
MARLIAVSGLAGVGKTTAIDFLEGAGFGRRVYVGQFVLDAVAARRLPLGPDNEREVRSEIRKLHGPAAFAQLAAPAVEQILRSSSNVLLDSILGEEELKYYQSRFDRNLELIFISASFEVRVSRLAQRPERSFAADDLRKRDDYENQVLGLNRVSASARKHLLNHDSLGKFCEDLEVICADVK